MEKLKERWQIESNFQIVIILVVFALNGSLTVALAKPVIHLIGISQELTNPLLFWAIRIVLMFIIYQILLVSIGSLFGQHRFFWKMEKKMLTRMGFKKFFKEND